MLGGGWSLCIFSLRLGVGVEVRRLDRRAVSVDDHEFGALFVSHDGRRYGLGVPGTGDRGQAEELAQDALVRTDRRWALVGPPEDAMVIWAAVRQLPARQRAVIVLGYYEDLSEVEVARLWGLPLGT
jgi:DNA-directed RNA polymerase specialized sigma24 family protein